MRTLSYLLTLICITQTPALANDTLDELTQIVQSGITEFSITGSSTKEDQLGTTDQSKNASLQEILNRIQNCESSKLSDSEKNLVAKKELGNQFTTYAFSCHLPGKDVVSSEVFVSTESGKPEVVSFQELRFEERTIDRDQLLRTMMLGDSLHFQSDANASPGISTLITLAKVGVPVALSFKAAKILSPVRTDWQKHYIAGALISGATILTAEGIIRVMNHQRGWGLSNAKIHLLSSFAGLLSSIAAGAAKEIIWDKRLGHGHPEFKDALYTAAGGASVSFTVAIPLEKLFGRRRIARAF